MGGCKKVGCGGSQSDWEDRRRLNAQERSGNEWPERGERFGHWRWAGGIVNDSDGVSPGDGGCASNTRGIVQDSAICSQCGTVSVGWG